MNLTHRSFNFSFLFCAILLSANILPSQDIFNSEANSRNKKEEILKSEKAFTVPVTYQGVYQEVLKNFGEIDNQSELDSRVDNFLSYKVTQKYSPIFRDGLVAINSLDLFYSNEKSNNNVSYYNTQGELVIPKGRYTLGSAFGDGRAFAVDINQELHLIDTKGNSIKKLKFDASGVCGVFSDGLAPVRYDPSGGYDEQIFYIDKQGDIAFSKITYQGEKVELIDAWSFSDGLAAVFFRPRPEYGYSEPLCGYINTKGEVILANPKWRSVRKFSDGLAAVQLKDPSDAYSNLGWEYINKSGESVIDLLFENAYAFSDGLAPVKYGGSWGYIDKKGVFKIQPSFSYASPFSDGRALVIDLTQTSNTINSVLREGRNYLDYYRDRYFPWFTKLNQTLPSQMKFINTSGEVVSNELVALPFSDGLAATFRIEDQNIKELLQGKFRITFIKSGSSKIFSTVNIMIFVVSALSILLVAVIRNKNKK